MKAPQAYDLGTLTVIMTRPIIILFFSLHAISFSQTSTKGNTELGPYYIYDPLTLLDKKEAKITMDFHAPNYIESTELINGDTTIFSFPKEIELQRKLIFKHHNLCNFDQLVFANSKSAQDYLDKIINANRYGWKKITDTRYLSKSKYKLELTIEKNKVTYKMHDLSTKEYKQLIKQK